MTAPQKGDPAYEWDDHPKRRWSFDKFRQTFPALSVSKTVAEILRLADSNGLFSGRRAEHAPTTLTIYLAFLQYGFSDPARHSLPRALVSEMEMTQNQMSSLVGHGLPEIPFDRNRIDRMLADAISFASTCSQDKILAARHLLAAILVDFLRQNTVSAHVIINFYQMGKVLRENIAHHTKLDSRERWLEILTTLDAVEFVFPQPRPDSRGSGLMLRRRADRTEAGLNVEIYADVLAEVLWHSDREEVCLAVFAPWGRGKTYLMERTAERLATRAGHETIFFSAWKYPSRPEVWIHLYETIFRKMRCSGWFSSFAHVCRAGLARHGWGPLVSAGFLLLVSAAPKDWLLKQTNIWLRNWLETSGSIVALLGLTLLAWRFWHTKGALEHTYLKQPSRAKDLGLQATIGDDLKSLLKGWITGVGEDAPRRWTPRFWPWFGIGAAIGMIIAVTFYRFSHSPAIAWCVTVILFLAYCFVSAAFIWAAPRPQRIVLVVDDLDRCEPDHLLSVVESIKLMLEDDEISRRVQVVMLVEEAILKHAIWKKYAHLLEKHACDALGSKHSAAKIVRDNGEKIFTAHLRLSDLTLEEMDEMVLKFGKKPRVVSISKALSEDTQVNAPDADDMAARWKAGDRGSIAEMRPSDIPALDHLLREEERNSIRQALRDAPATVREAIGPRAIRAVLFRYQLVRLLLDALQVRNWNHEDVARMIVAHDTEVAAVDTRIKYVVQQIL